LTIVQIVLGGTAASHTVGVGGGNFLIKRFSGAGEQLERMTAAQVQPAMLLRLDAQLG